MSELANYVAEKTRRGACMCGKCIDAGTNPQANQPTGHTSDLVFFKVSAQGAPHAETLRNLIRAHKGDFCEVNPLDGEEHSYLELGGWIGDQGTAMQLMGLGELLGLWKVLSLRSLFGKAVTDEHVMQAAGNGLLSIITAKETQPSDEGSLAK